jgi:hypothetical protein
MLVVNKALHWSALLAVAGAAFAGVGAANAKTGLDRASRVAVKEQVCANTLARFQSDMNVFAQQVRLGTRHSQLTNLKRAAGQVQRGRALGCDWA